MYFGKINKQDFKTILHNLREDYITNILAEI